MQVDSSLVFGRQACLRQLASLVRIAADLFADFEAEAVAVDRRTRRLSERLLRLQLVVDAVDSASITVRKSRSISSAVRLLDWMSLDPVLAALHPALAVSMAHVALFYSIWLGLTLFCPVLPSFTQFYPVLPSFTQFYLFIYEFTKL